MNLHPLRDKILRPDETLKNAVKTGVSDEGAAHAQRAEPEANFLDADLQLVVDHWSDLPEAVRAGILAMIRATLPPKTT